MEIKLIAQQVIRFSLMTCLSASITVGGPIIFHEGFRISEEISVGLSLFIAFFVNFFTAKHLVFESCGDSYEEFRRFLLSSIIFRLLEYISFLILFNFFGVNYVVAVCGILGTSLILKFLCYRFIVFTPKGV